MCVGGGAARAENISSEESLEQRIGADLLVIFMVEVGFKSANAAEYFSCCAHACCVCQLFA